MTTVEDCTNLKVGQMVAVKCENYTQDPAIGRCTEISADSLQVEWYKGSYTTSWRPWLIRDPTNRRKSVPWCDWIPTSSVVLFDFELTKSNHLRKSTIENLYSTAAIHRISTLPCIPCNVIKLKIIVIMLFLCDFNKNMTAKCLKLIEFE